MGNFSELFNQIDKSENKQTTNDLMIENVNTLLYEKNKMFTNVAENMGKLEELPLEVREKLNILDTVRLKDDVESKELKRNLNESTVVMEYLTLSSRLNILLTYKVNYNGNFIPHSIFLKDMEMGKFIYRGTFKGLSEFKVLDKELIEYNTNLINLIELRGTVVSVDSLEKLVDYSTLLIENIALNEDIILFLQNVMEMKQYKKRLINRCTLEYNANLGLVVKYDNLSKTFNVYRDLYPKQFFVFDKFPSRLELRELERYFNTRVNTTMTDIAKELEILKLLELYNEKHSHVRNLITNYKKSFGKIILRKNKFSIYINTDHYIVTFLRDNKMYRETINTSDELLNLVKALLERKLI